MASLTDSTIAATYDRLLALPSGGLNGNNLVAITDGDSSTAIGMKVATNKIEVIPGSDDANAFEVSKADGTAVLTVNTSTVGATLIGALTVGVDDTGHDVKFFGATATNGYMLWDESTDDLILGSASKMGIGITAPKTALEVGGVGGAHVTLSHTPINASDIADNDLLGQIDFAGYDTDYSGDFIIGARIRAQVDGTWDASGGGNVADAPTELQFITLNSDTSHDVDHAINLNMVIKSDGNVGIGTASPGEVLTVNDTIRLDNGDSSIDADQVFGDIEFYDNDGGSASAGVTARIECEAVGAVGGSELNFFTSSSSGGARSSITQQMTIDNNGSVGIGTDAPDTILDVRQSNDGGTTTLNLVNTAGTGSSDETIAITAQHTTSESKGGKIEFFRSGDYSTTGQSQGGIKFYSTDDNTDNLAMTIIKSKYVGIGIASPLAHLHVQDTGVSTTASFTGAQFLHTKTAGTSDASDHMTGLAADMNFNDGSNFFGEMSGAILKATAQAASSGESTFIKGAHIQAEMTGNTDINSIYGIYNLVDINAGEIDSSAYGIFNRVDMESGMSGTFDVYGYYCTTDSDTDKNTYMHYLEGASNTDYHYLNYSATVGSTTSRISDAGQIDAEGTINASQSLDYAEYFESKDGKAIAVGTTVKLDGDKIVACEDGDTPIGAIRPLGASGVVGGAQHFHWQGKHEKDDYDGTVMENFSWTSWTVEVDEAEYYKRRDERERQKYKRVDGSKAIPAKEAVVQQKVVDEEVEKEVTTTSLVDGKYVQKTETVTKTVQVPQYDEVDLYNEDGKVIGKYQVPIMETVEEAVAAVDAVPDTYFKKHKYHTDRIPSGLTAPDDATVIQSKNKRPKLNSSYDASKEESYKSREERDEWCIVGLLGQIPITKGQPLSSNWIKMKDVSDTVEMYFVK